MKSSRLFLACPCRLACSRHSRNIRARCPDIDYEFPQDHFSHPDYQTEWWYYTGNVTAADGHRFGFELTFFRQGVNRGIPDRTAWDIRDLYLAHLAVSDIDGKLLPYRTPEPRRAGNCRGRQLAAKIWNGNWSVSWTGDGNMQLNAIDTGFNFSLLLQPEKPLVIQGENGVSQKAEGTGKASHYISFTRLKTTGKLELNNKIHAVTGIAWMDHEFFTHSLETNQAGWDWLSLQFTDNSELMLYQIRRKDGSVDPYSSGTYTDAHGKSILLHASDFVLEPNGETWKSPTTSASYPIEWRISVPKLGITLETQTDLKQQEISGQTIIAPSYWEGAIRVGGHKNGATMEGVGYLEMTGYDRPVELGGLREP